METLATTPPVIATRWERLGANLLDQMLLMVCVFILAFAITFTLTLLGVQMAEWVGVAIGVIFPYFIYYPITTILWQATPGKMALGIKVVSEDYQQMDASKIYLRESIFKIVGHMLFGSIWIFFTKNKRCAWDLFAHSLVIKA